MTERYKDYLQGGLPFIVFTDNNPLTYVLSSAKLNAVALRWVNDLADFNFTIKYRPGKVNVDADYLSRRPLDIKELKRGCTETVDPRCLDAVLAGVGHGADVSSCCVSVAKLSLEGVASSAAIPRDVLIEEQKSDKIIGPVYSAVVDQKRPGRDVWSSLEYESKVLLHNWKRLKIVNGVLMRETAQRLQVVLPVKYHQLVYTELHEKLAHLGSDRVLELARQRFFWPKMARDIKNYVQKRCRCIADKKPNIPERAQMMSIESSYPFEVVAIDFIHLDKCKGKFEYVLVVTDLFTKYVQMYATKKKSSKAAAEKLFNEFVVTYGLPKRIMHDRGGEFNSDLFKELHRLAGIESSNTTPYHPMSNGQCERMNRSLVSMLKALSPAEKKDWKSVLPKLSFAYNSTHHASTGYTPFFLMFGRESRLPIDEVFAEVQMEDQGKLRSKSHQQFVEQWKKSMQEVFRLAKEKNEKVQVYNKGKYDQKVKEIGIEEGDHVLVKNLREKEGTGKLRSHWEHHIFEVVNQQGDLPVFKVRNLDKPKDIRVLHRNHLMKCEELPLDVFKEVDSEVEKEQLKPKKTQRGKPAAKPKATAKPKAQELEHDDDDEESCRAPDSDDEGEIHMVFYPDVGTEDQIQSEQMETDVHHEEATEDASQAGVERLILVDLDVTPELEEETVEEVELRESNEQEEPEEDTDEEEEPLRRSTRMKTAAKRYTYQDLGGNPTYSDMAQS